MISKKDKITVQGTEITVISEKDSDYISLTDMAGYKDELEARVVVSNWMSTRFTLEFLGIWEEMFNPDFNRMEFHTIKNSDGRLVLTPKRWGSKIVSCQLLNVLHFVLIARRNDVETGRAPSLQCFRKSEKWIPKSTKSNNVMDVKINQLNEYEREMEITIPWELVGDDYNDLLKQYAKLPVKGFRPGKTPLSAIESAFRSQLKNELAARCSTRFCRKALADHSLEAGSPLNVTDIQLAKDRMLQLKVNFIEMPPFELPDYLHLDLRSAGNDGKLDEISLKLLERTGIRVPPVMVENELAYAETEGEPDESEREAATQRVKLMMILKKIAGRDNIEIGDRDIDDRIERIAEENDVTAAQLKEYLTGSGGLPRLADSLLAEAVLQYIIEAQEA